MNNMESGLNIVYWFREQARDLDLSVTAMYSFPFINPGLSALFSLSEWVVEYHDEDAGIIRFFNPGAKVKLARREKNTVHLYAPGCSFREDTSKSKSPRQETHMNFKGGELCGLNKFIGETAKYCRFLDGNKRIGEILERAALLCAMQGESAFWDLQSLLCRCISILLNSSRRVSENTYEILGRDSRKPELTEAVETYIRHHISQTIKNSQLAGHVNMSESTFNHRFRQKAGVSPKTRVLEMKIDAAKGLLLTGKRLKEIAALTGFYDEFHLSKTFKKVTGSTPMEFRESGQ